MKKLLTAACVAAISLAAPVAASAAKPSKSDRQQAKQTCKQLRAESGKANFASMFGEGKKGLGRCIRRESRENSEERVEAAQEARTNAAQDCRAERQADTDAFAENYGTNANNRNAFGKCVSQKARERNDEEEQEPQP
jgi:hypothetical protein